MSLTKIAASSSSSSAVSKLTTRAMWRALRSCDIGRAHTAVRHRGARGHTNTAVPLLCPGCVTLRWNSAVAQSIAVTVCRHTPLGRTKKRSNRPSHHPHTGPASADARIFEMRTWPITALLAFKLLTQTLPSGVIVLLDPAGAVKESGQPAPLTEPFFLHMVFMWAVWMCFFQAPLEFLFGFGFAGYGRQRTAYLLAETIFEIALLVECEHRRASARLLLFTRSAPLESSEARPRFAVPHDRRLSQASRPAILPGRRLPCHRSGHRGPLRARAGFRPRSARRLGQGESDVRLRVKTTLADS